MRTLGVVTIGQAPRDDIVDELTALLPPCRVVQHGALDTLSREEVAALAPADDEDALVSRLVDGSSVVMRHDAVVPLVETAVTRAEDDGADAVLVVCSGSFPTLKHRQPLLFTEALAHHGLTALAGDGRVGVVRPLPGQLDDARTAWGRTLGRPVAATAAVSPYPADLDAVGATAAGIAADCDVIVLDCMGYDEPMRAAAAAAARRPVLLVRSLAARLVGELLT